MRLGSTYRVRVPPVILCKIRTLLFAYLVDREDRTPSISLPTRR